MIFLNIIVSRTTFRYRKYNRIGGVMVRVLASRVVDRALEPRSCQTKDDKICICCFSAKHTTSRSKSKDWLARNQNNVCGGTCLSADCCVRRQEL